jgi:hypothetical protein
MIVLEWEMLEGFVMAAISDVFVTHNKRTRIIQTAVV